MSVSVVTKPDRTIEYLGMTLKLFGSKHIRRILQRKPVSFGRAEKSGWIPKPMFHAGHVKYYTSYELETLSDLVRTDGVPKFRPKGADVHPWAIELRTRWDRIREELKAGKLPKSACYLKFSSEDEITAALGAVLRPAGIDSGEFLKTVRDGLLRYRVW